MNRPAVNAQLAHGLLLCAFALVALTFALAPRAAEAKLKCDDPDVVILKEYLPTTGDPYWYTFRHPKGEGGYGIKISGYHHPKGERRPQEMEQDEFDILLSRAKSWRKTCIGYKETAGWRTDVQFAATPHFTFACDIKNLSLHGGLGSDGESVIKAYADRGERIWVDFEAVFGPTAHGDIGTPVVLFLMDQLNECRQTTMTILNYTREPVGALRGHNKISCYWDRGGMPADTDIWEYFTHMHAGNLVSVWKGRGRNNGSIPAWIDEGFAYYLTRIHRELDTHTTILFQEASIERPRHIDGGSWKSHAEGLARNGNYDIEKIWKSAASTLTQDQRILAWSMIAFMIETEKEMYLPKLMAMDKAGEKDGKVTREEFEGDPSRFDIDLDGELNASEQRQSDDAWRAADINNDGVIDIESEAVAVNFRRWIHLQKQDKTDMEATEQVYGWTLGDFEARWLAWLSDRPFVDPGAVDLDSQTAWKDFEKAFERAWAAATDPVKKARILLKLARWQIEEALRTLYEVLAVENDVRIHEAGRRVVAVWTDAEITNEVFNLAYNGKIGRKKADDLPTRVSLYRAYMLDSANAPVNRDIAKGCTHEEFSIRVAACDILGARGVSKDAHKHIDAVIKCLSDTETPVRVAAVHALVNLANVDNELTILQALIDTLYAEKGVLRGDLYEALKQISQEDWGPSYHRWARWLQLYRAAKRGGDPKPKVDPGHEGDDRTGITDDPTYLEDPIYSKQIVFVIDRSYSMIDPVENAGAIQTELDKKRRERGVTTGPGSDNADEDETDEDELDWSKIKTKWDLARETLLKAIDSLPDDCKFTVILYDHRVWTWSEVMVPATAQNKKALRDWLTTQPNPRDPDVNKAWGLTNIYDALAKGLEITVGERVQRRGDGQQQGGVITGGGEDDIELSQRGAEEIFLLSDGEPTDGTYVNEDDIVRNIREINRTRKVKISTFGIGKDHSRSLMERIAKESHGKYTDLGF